mmetsp:Transcript_8217/g.13279  ORF Transcript_8217/g.13279 Transcript_8217/m.13279 type:complete len:105 (+) Transcript_8217:315-629(+)
MIRAALQRLGNFSTKNLRSHYPRNPPSHRHFLSPKRMHPESQTFNSYRTLPALLSSIALCAFAGATPLLKTIFQDKDDLWMSWYDAILQTHQQRYFVLEEPQKN